MKNRFVSKIVVALVVLSLESTLSLGQTWQLVTPKYGANDAIVAGFVADAATYGNGTTDATTYIQSCLNSLDNAVNDANHGGGVLFLPEGKYRVNGTLIIPKGITIRGDWQQPVKGQPIKGTILMAYSGKGNATGTPFIMMESGAAVMDLAFWYPEQDANNITPFPPTIQFGRPNYFGDEFCNAKNITLVNAYNGIYFYNGGGTCPTINGVYGTPLKQGVEIDRIVDIGRIEWCDFSPAYWAGSGLAGAPALSNTVYTQWLYNNGSGIVMRRNDWSYTCYVNVEGYNIGFCATMTINATEKSTPNGHNYGFKFKNCKYGLYFDGNNTVGIMFTDMKTTGCEYGVYLSPNTGGVLQLYKWNFADTKYALFSDKGSSTKITMQECTVTSGKVNLQGGTLVTMDNDFNNAAPQISFEMNSRGNLTGNRFLNPVQISEKSVFVNQINHTPIAVKKLPAYYEFKPLAKKPSRSAFYNAVSGFGATVGTRNNIPEADATTAIQNALNKAKTDGGGVVYLQPGHYRINGSLTIPTGVELKGSVDVGEFPMGPGSVLEIYGSKGNEAGTPAVVMQANSGLRGVVFNYPEQVFCTVLPESVIKYPYSIQVQGSDAYIVNVGMRAVYKGVDIFTYRCDRHYVDYLTGHVFNVGIKVGNGSADGIISNAQFNTIVYNCGDESKFGGWPNSLRSLCSADAMKNPYDYNAKYLDFLIVGDAPNIMLYNDFNYCANHGLILTSGAQGTAIGLGLDGDRTGILVDGSANFDFINTQDVSLNFDALGGEKSSYIKTTSNFSSGSINLFSSDYWGQATSSGIVMDGAGTVNLQSANFESPGSQSFANVNAGKLELGCSVVNPKNPLVNGTSIGGANIQGSLVTPYTLNTASLGKCFNNIGAGPQASANSAISRTGWIATASRNSDASRTPQAGIDNNATTSWSGGWQNDGIVQWYQVDMITPQTFNEVILEHAGSPDDFPGTYTFSVSTNGTDWTPLVTSSGTSQMDIIALPQTTTARYIKIDKPATVTKSNYWAIHELYVFNLTPSGTTESGAFTGMPALIPGTVEAENYDLGGEGVAYHDVTAANEGNQYRTFEGVDVETCGAGGFNIGYTAAGEWTKYTVLVASTGKYTIDCKVASGTSGTFSVEVDGVDITGTLTAATTGWQDWQSVTKSGISLAQGTHILTFKTTGGINVDNFIFTSLATEIENKSNADSVIIFPNPSIGLFNITISQLADIRICDINGLTIFTAQLTEHQCSIDLKTYPAGMYFATIVINNQVTRLKLIKK